ncbi:MAG TPA: AraC family transcriptional regulator ligand-binding domain-containing protein [Steroidobacteraceae bacterium]|nr:AraC family transcriptional regulator ligand-binding domain-containing protein [Steroidobacteraceae bacterium]
MSGFEGRVYPLGPIATIVNSLAREGIPASQALAGARLTARALRSQDTRVSVNQILRVLRNATELSRDPYLAHHTGQRFHFSILGMYGFAMLTSPSFRQGIHFAVRYQQLVLPLVSVSFAEDHGTGIWNFVPIAHPSIDPALARFLIEQHLSATITLHRDGMGSSFVPLKIHLRFGRPRDATKYEQMFGCPVLFDQEEHQLIFDAAWLDREAILGNEIAHYEAVKLCDDLLEQLQLRAGIAGKIRNLLLTNRLAPMSCAEVARQLRMTGRTLRRRLREERTSFRKVAYELRMRMAVEYLRDTDLTIQEIGRSLGFREDASFRHAFRRWTKTAPQRFRGHLTRAIRRK